MATGVFIGQVTLDVNMYRVASRLFAADGTKSRVDFETLTRHHVKDVKRAQDFYQTSELAASASDIRGGGGFPAR